MPNFYARFKHEPSGSNPGPTHATTRSREVVEESPYAKIPLSPQRPDLLCVGVYTLKVMYLEETVHPHKRTKTIKAHFSVAEIVDGGEEHVVGDHVIALFPLSGNGIAASLERVQQMIMAIAGFDDGEEFLAFSSDGGFIEACLGLKTSRSQKFLDNVPDGEEVLSGRSVRVVVTRGNDIGDSGDYFRNYRWSVVPD